MRFHTFPLVIAFVCFVGIIFLFMQSKTHPGAKQLSKRVPSPSVATRLQKKLTLFVPYWSMNGQVIDSTTYNRLVYFGVTVNTQGINTHEDGYHDIDAFLSVTSSRVQRLLCIRMTDTDENNNVLSDKNLQKKIIQQSIDLAHQKGFDGIVLDFEISALGFDKITKNITAFENTFADTVKHNHLKFFSTMYGDTFIRFRPFDVGAIAGHDDGIMIMAYDFHKANGNPGPNFPLDSTEDGYDFSTMIGDFEKEVPDGKITVLFGLFGYDWTIDSKGNSIKAATSLSDNEIKEQFLDTCDFMNCVISTNPQTAETHISYTDTDDNTSHVVWFEDMRSIARKVTVLQTKGVGSIGYWAYSYF